MPHSVKPKSSSKQHATSYSGGSTGAGAANGMMAFADHLDAVQATTMMQVWHDERDPSNLTFSESMELRGSLGSAGGGGKKKKGSTRCK